MSTTYDEIISVVRGDIQRLEELIFENNFFSETVFNSLLKAPAKRIRPALAFLFLRAWGFEVDEAQFQLLCAVELAHTASLIHDDIIDKSTIRRGQSTLNAIYGDKYAVLAGDYTLSVALDKILSLKNDEITKDFINVFSQMSLGEIAQLTSKNRIPTLEEYLEKTTQKTAGLFRVALKSSAILTQNQDIVQFWNYFGQNFGIAFQIKNDLKDIKTDVENGIYTAPVIFAKSTEITSDAIKASLALKNRYIFELESKLMISPQDNEYFGAIKDLLELMKNDK